MAGINTFTDDFHAATRNNSKWGEYTASGGTFTYDNSGASSNLPASSVPGSDASLYSQHTYDATNGHAILHVLSVPNSATRADAVISLNDTPYDGSNHVSFFYEAGYIYASKTVGGVQTNLASAVYNATNHAWWRIRESGGTTYWDVSANGISWTNFTSAANPIGMTAVEVDIGSSTWQNETNPGSFKFEYFNPLGISPSASTSSSISPSSSQSPSASTSASRSPSSSLSPSASVSPSLSPSASSSPSASISPSSSQSLSPSSSSSPSASASPSSSPSLSVSPSSSISPSSSASSSFSSSPSAAFIPPITEVAAIVQEDHIIAVEQPDTDLRLVD